MNRRTSSELCLVLTSVFTLACASLVRADDPTSKFVPLAPIPSTLPPSASGLTVQFEIWDQASGGTRIYSETHTVDTDADSQITNDTTFADLLLGRPNGLNPENFPYGSSRYLDATLDGPSVLVARLPLYASVFSLTDSGFIAGNLTMVNSTATAGNLIKGGVLFLHNFGTNNTFLGQNAGNLTMTGLVNTASGVNALRNNTTGSGNTASGFGALLSNTTGSSNTASGLNALRNNTIGDENTAIGVAALSSNTNTGRRNTASGAYALFNNTTGYNNTASGWEALFSNTTGSLNTAIGVEALNNNTTASYNTATGFTALFGNTTGEANTASGYGALFSNTTGGSNTASGNVALSLNTTGSNNTASGVQALQRSTIGDNNTASGFDALSFNTTGRNNTASGVQALRDNTTGSNNTAIGASANVSAENLTNATAIGSGAIVNASNKIRLGNTAITVIEGQVPYTFTSDRNQKENFQPVDGEQVLRKIGGLSLPSWNYIGHDPQQFRHYGPVAQEFFAAFGHDGVGRIGTETTINSGDLAGILMIAVQALEKRTAENAELKARVEALERLVKSTQTAGIELRH